MIGPLYAEEYGQGGRPVLLLHGLGGGVSMWSQVAPLLAAGRRILVPDLLGFGRSPRPDVEYSIDDHLDALERLLEERGLAAEELDIAGHSMGAILAAEFAARQPDRVRGLALVNLAYLRSKLEINDAAIRLGPLTRLTLGAPWKAKLACGLMCALRPLLILVAPYFVKSVPAAVVRDGLRHNFNSYSRSLRNVVLNHGLDATLELLAHRPVLLVHGDHDPLIPVGQVLPLAERFPPWRLEVLTDAGHLLPVEQPARIAELLESVFHPSAEPPDGEPDQSAPRPSPLA